MEGLIEIVAASFARHGIECPAADSQLVWGPAPSQACPEPSRSVQAERSSAVACSQGNSGLAIDQAIRPAEPPLTSALPDRNYRESSQADPTP